MAYRDRGKRDALAAVLLWVAGVGALLTLGAAVASGLGTAASVGVGALLAASNLWALAVIVRAIFGGGGGAGVGVFAFLKMIGLFVIVWILLRAGVVTPLPLLVGYGALPLGIVGAALTGSLRRP